MGKGDKRGIAQRSDGECLFNVNWTPADGVASRPPFRYHSIACQIDLLHLNKPISYNFSISLTNLLLFPYFSSFTSNILYYSYLTPFDLYLSRTTFVIWLLLSSHIFYSLLLSFIILLFYSHRCLFLSITYSLLFQTEIYLRHRELKGNETCRRWNFEEFREWS